MSVIGVTLEPLIRSSSQLQTSITTRPKRSQLSFAASLSAKLAVLPLFTGARGLFLPHLTLSRAVVEMRSHFFLWPRVFAFSGGRRFATPFDASAEGVCPCSRAPQQVPQGETEAQFYGLLLQCKRRSSLW